MKFKQLLTKTLLVAAGLLTGASAWAQTTIGSTSTGWGEGITSAYTLPTGKTLNFTFTVDASAGTADYQGYVAILAKTNASTWGENQYLFLRSQCDYAIGGTWNTGAIANSDTYGETSKVAFFTGATVNMAIKRIGTNVLVTTAITKEATTYYHYYQQNLGTTDDVYAFLAADAAQLTITNDAITDNGLTEEEYNFASNTSTTNYTCNAGESIIDSWHYILSLDNYEMNGRFAGGKASGSSWWYYLKNNSGLKNGAANKTKNFAVLNLIAGDYVIIDYTNSAYDPGNITFAGDSNISGNANGTGVVSGQAYEMASSGNLMLTLGRDVIIKAINIYTSKPVLKKPTISFNNMVINNGLYYPQVTFTSEEGVTFKNGSGEVILSPYTFTSAGTLTIYATKEGRTNSAKVSYAVNNGWILANSVSTSDLVGTINYETGAVLADNTQVGGAKWIIPGLHFEGTNITYRTWGILPTSGNRTVSCSVLNENRIATYQHYNYSTKATTYDYLTSASNAVSFLRKDKDNYDRFNAYALYVNPSEVISVTIGSTGYSTFSCPVPLDFTGVSGLTAYVAKSVDGENVTLSSVTTAPANTGLVLKGTVGETYNIPVTNAAETPASNLLVGCIVNTTVAADATSKFNNYVLVSNGGAPEFQSLVDNGATITVGKAFLSNGAYSTGARSLTFAFDDETTGISSINNEQSTTNNVFDLQGRRVAAPQKGLYIVNGKKVIIK